MGWKEQIADIDRKIDAALEQSVEAQVRRLDVRDGDILAVTYRTKQTQADLGNIRQGILAYLKNNGESKVDVLVLDDDPVLTVIGQED